MYSVKYWAYGRGSCWHLNEEQTNRFLGLMNVLGKSEDSYLVEKFINGRLSNQV